MLFAGIHLSFAARKERKSPHSQPSAAEVKVFFRSSQSCQSQVDFVLLSERRRSRGTDDEVSMPEGDLASSCEQEQGKEEDAEDKEKSVGDASDRRTSCEQGSPEWRSNRSSVEDDRRRRLYDLREVVWCVLRSTPSSSSSPSKEGPNDVTEERGDSDSSFLCNDGLLADAGRLPGTADCRTRDFQMPLAAVHVRLWPLWKISGESSMDIVLVQNKRDANGVEPERSTHQPFYKQVDDSRPPSAIAQSRPPTVYKLSTFSSH